MDEFAAQVLAVLVAHKPRERASSPAEDIVVGECNWFENAESRLFDFSTGARESMLVDASDCMSAMETKQACRQLLASSGYTEAGWPALALFDHLLVSFGTGEDFMQASGWTNVPPETGYGLVPCLFVSNAAFWSVSYLNSVKAGDVELAAKCLCKLACVMTMLFMACPRPRLKEEDQPSADELA